MTAPFTIFITNGNAPRGPMIMGTDNPCYPFLPIALNEELFPGPVYLSQAAMNWQLQKLAGMADGAVIWGGESPDKFPWEPEKTTWYPGFCDFTRHKKVKW